MTRDDVIRMAREAGLLNCECCLPFFDEDDHKNWERFFVNFAALVAAHERQPLTATAIGNHLRRKDSGEFSLYRNGFKDGVRWAERKHKIGVVNDPQ